MFDYRALPAPKGQVELLETIGKGNFGYVYRGRMTRTRKIAAVKVVQIKMEELREILLEVEILQQCRHPNITEYFDTFVRDQDLWICMEFCGAGAVDSVYRQLPRPLSEDEIGVFLLEAFKGLQYLHKEMHIIHRDIKSGNLLLTESGELKLADFGVSAVTTSANNYRAHSFIGTPYWMAPEVIMAENAPEQMYDAKADIWSMGITAIELADKNPPFSDIHPMRALYLIPQADPSKFMVLQPKKFSKPFVQFIQFCMVRDPRRRPGCTEVLAHPFMQRTAALKSSQVILKVLKDVKEEKEKRNTAGRRRPKRIETDEDEEQDFPDDDAAQEPEPNKKPAAQPAQLPKPQGSTPGIHVTPEPSRLSSDKPPSMVSDSPRSTGSSLRSAFKSVFKPISRSLSKSSVEEESLTNDENVQVEELASLMGKLGTDKLPFDCIPLGLQLNHEVLCADMLYLGVQSDDPNQDKFKYIILLGTEKGLYAADVTLHMEKSAPPKDPQYTYSSGGRVRQIIRGTRFKELHVMEDYDVMMALAGKSNQIRSYALDSLKKLIAYYFGFQLKKSAQKSHDPLAPVAYGHVDEMETPEFWISDFEKILHTKDSQSFLVKRTKITAYMGVIGKNQITIFEWAKLPYLKFMKVKEFWMPETPRFFELFHDGFSVYELFVSYEREAVMIEFESSKVIEIVDDEALKQRFPKDVAKDREQNRWLSWTQLPVKVDDEKQGTKSPGKPAIPAQLSWYQTMQTMKPKKKDQALPLDRDFLATYGNFTRRVNIQGQLVEKHRDDKLPLEYRWSVQLDAIANSNGAQQPQPTAPKRVVCLPEYLLGVHLNFFQVLDIHSGKISQAQLSPNPIRLLVPPLGSDLGERRRGRFCFSSFNKKQKKSHIYWLKETNVDPLQQEVARRYQDRVERPQRVIGSSVVSSKPIDYSNAI